jgi:hypothetical protein
VVARRGDGETEGAERGTRDEPWSRARSAPGLARRFARARALRRRHSALLVTRGNGEVSQRGKKEEGRRSVGGSRMTRFAGLSTREKGSGRTLVFGDTVAFLKTPPMVAFDAAFALAAAPPRRRCDVKKADSSPPALPRRESFGEDEPSTRSGLFVLPRKCKDDVLKNTRDALLLLAHLRVSTVVGADTSACAGGRRPHFTHFFAKRSALFPIRHRPFQRSTRDRMSIQSERNTRSTWNFRREDILVGEFMYVLAPRAVGRTVWLSLQNRGASTVSFQNDARARAVRRGSRAAPDPSPRWRRRVEARARVPPRTRV